MANFPREIGLQNDFHNTSVIVRPARDGRLSVGQQKRTKRALCGIDGCTCSDAWGMRGPQPFDSYWHIEETGPSGGGYLSIGGWATGE